MQQEINIRIGVRQPSDYMQITKEGIINQELKIGGINSEDELMNNLRENAIPEMIFEAGVDHYSAFLVERRNLMSRIIQRYYQKL